MSVDEADVANRHLNAHAAASFGLTILAADLLYKSTYGNHSQGNYDYDAHAHMYRGGADPLGSQGYANAVRNPFSSLEAAREAKSSRAFLFLERSFRGKLEVQATSCTQRTAV